MLATVKAALRVPPLTAHVAWVTGVPEIEQEVSVLWKPEPVTCTLVVGPADEGLRVIDGGETFTVNVADAKSPS
jgi:hypothetical protein